MQRKIRKVKYAYKKKYAYEKNTHMRIKIRKISIKTEI